MANWCENNLFIFGDEADIKHFNEKAQGYATPEDKADDIVTPLLLNNLYPWPKEQDDNEYNWCIMHWGVRGDITAVGLSCEDTTMLEYDFFTAWSPPVL